MRQFEFGSDLCAPDASGRVFHLRTFSIKLRALAACMAWLAVVTGSSLAQTSSYGYDLHGKPIMHLELPGTQAVVLFFIATDCPISNRYVPEIQRLQAEFSGKPVAVWIVYPNATETESGMVRHQASFGLAGATLARPSSGLMSMARPTVTPESVVLVREKSGWRAAYVGRIDDRYVAFGKERPQATHHELEAAVLAVLDHQTPQAAGSPPVGCGIVSEAALHSGAGKP